MPVMQNGGVTSGTRICLMPGPEKKPLSTSLVGDEGSDPNSGTLCPSSPRQECISNVSNTTVVSYIKRQGGTHSLSLYRLTRELFQWANLHQVTLNDKYIPGRSNARADLLSRKGQIIKAEWSLSRRVFRQILGLFPWLQVDLLRPN